MKKLLLALSIAVLSQGVFAEIDPGSQIFISPGLTGVTIESTSKIEMISSADCTRSTAESHAYAYPASGYNNTLIWHKGRHEAIITNCTGQTASFNVEVELKTINGERIYANNHHYLANQSREVITHDSSFYDIYSNAGYFDYTATTTITGPASHKAVHTGLVSVR